MAFALIGMAVLGIYLYLRERRRRRQLERELAYLSEKIELRLSGEEAGLILLQTESAGIKTVVTNINNLLEANYRNKSEFGIMKKNILEILADVSHDLRTPLTILKGCIEMLQIKMRPINAGQAENETTAIIAKLNQKIDETIEITNRFFSVARLESGDTVLKIKKMDICKISRDIILEYYNLLAQYQFNVNIQIPEKPVWGEIDEEAFDRILRNLIDNVIKYGVKGGYFGITVREEADLISVCIEDHGPGILKKDIPRIFERNYTVSQTEPPGYKSSGLGLFISRKLARQMNGDIVVQSEPDLKTVFELIIKLEIS